VVTSDVTGRTCLTLCSRVWGHRSVCT